MSEELSGVAVEASVWDLDGTCPYYKVMDNLSVPSKKVVRIVEMEYPKSKNPKPVYFLLLKLYQMSDNKIISRNFYWLHLPGGNYKLLEPYRNKKVHILIASKTSVKGSTYEIEMQVQNKSKQPNSKSLTYKNIFTTREGDGDFNKASTDTVHSGNKERNESGFLTRLCRRFINETGDNLKVTEVNGDDTGVAFFLHFSVHASKTNNEKGDDTRILPVHYSDNYFSLVPGENLPIKISFEAPPGVKPKVRLQGWNYHVNQTVL